MTATEKQTEAVEGGSSSHDLLAFTAILSGLLASGHYTSQPDEESDEPKILRCDYGKEWKEDCADDPTIYRRHMPCVLEDAEELLKGAKLICKANAPVHPTP